MLEYRWERSRLYSMLPRSMWRDAMQTEQARRSYASSRSCSCLCLHLLDPGRCLIPLRSRPPCCWSRRLPGARRPFSHREQEQVLSGWIAPPEREDQRQNATENDRAEGRSARRRCIPALLWLYQEWHPMARSSGASELLTAPGWPFLPASLSARRMDCQDQ